MLACQSVICEQWADRHKATFPISTKFGNSPTPTADL